MKMEQIKRMVCLGVRYWNYAILGPVQALINGTISRQAQRRVRNWRTWEQWWHCIVVAHSAKRASSGLNVLSSTCMIHMHIWVSTC